jgi:hypothetical protein
MPGAGMTRKYSPNYQNRVRCLVAVGVPSYSGPITRLGVTFFQLCVRMAVRYSPPQCTLWCNHVWVLWGKNTAERQMRDPHALATLRRLKTGGVRKGGGTAQRRSCRAALARRRGESGRLLGAIFQRSRFRSWVKPGPFFCAHPSPHASKNTEFNHGGTETRRSTLLPSR